MNNVEKSDYLHEGIRNLQKAIKSEDPLIVPIKLSLRTRLKKVLEGTRGIEIYEDLAERLIPIKSTFQEQDLSDISDAIKISPFPSLADVFKKELIMIDMGL